MGKADGALMFGSGVRGWKLAAWWVGVWAGIFGLCALVYSKGFRLGLIYDDVAMLLYFYRPTGFGWYDSFLPMDNGFMRPVYMLSFWAVWELVGPWEMAWRVFAVFVHSTVAVAAGVAFGSMAGVGRWAAVCVALTVALASSAFATVFYSANVADSLMALGMVAAVCCFDRWLVLRDSRWLWGSGAGLLFALMSKEAAVTLCGVFALQAWTAEVRRRVDGVFVGVATLICVAFAGLIWWMQQSVAMSYLNQGYSSLNPAVLVRRLVGYFTSTLFPGVYVLKPWWGDGAWVRGVSAVLQGGGAVVLMWAAAVMVMRRGPRLLRLAAVLTVGAVLVFLPTLVVNFEAGPHSPVGRYIYSSLVLVVLAGGCVAVWLYGEKPLVWRFGVAMWAGWLLTQPVVVRKSPGTQEYYECARQWQALAGEIRRLSPDWPSMRAISVFTGEPHGSFRLDETYANALVRVYFPGLLVYYASNRVIPETSFSYVFDGRRLSEVAQGADGTGAL